MVMMDAWQMRAVMRGHGLRRRFRVHRQDHDRSVEQTGKRKRGRQAEAQQGQDGSYRSHLGHMGWRMNLVSQSATVLWCLDRPKTRFYMARP
jgi:hypothetical protein